MSLSTTQAAAVPARLVSGAAAVNEVLGAVGAALPRRGLERAARR